jgi:predicted RNA-binding protein
MCLASVHKGKGSEKENLLEEVALIKFEGEKLLLRTLFGEERAIKAKIKEIDFMNSTVLIEED